MLNGCATDVWMQSGRMWYRTAQRVCFWFAMLYDFFHYNNVEELDIFFLSRGSECRNLHTFHLHSHKAFDWNFIPLIYIDLQFLNSKIPVGADEKHTSKSFAVFYLIRYLQAAQSAYSPRVKGEKEIHRKISPHVLCILRQDIFYLNVFFVATSHLLVFLGTPLLFLRV